MTTHDPMFQAMVGAADPSWQPTLERGLLEVASADPGYLTRLASSDFLPDGGRLFAAFTQPLSRVRHVLVGEGPYPRAASATGVCFMDGAVGSLWSETGLSKTVNRATSLRNFMKMLLVADGRLEAGRTSGDALTEVAAEARTDDSSMIQSLQQLQDNLLAQGFLLLNAALVFRADVPPLQEARAWRPFLQVVLAALAENAHASGQPLPQLVLWGKVASLVTALEISRDFPKVIAEHPYNLSFIVNRLMHDFFGPMMLLKKPVDAERRLPGR